MFKRNKTAKTGQENTSETQNTTNVPTSEKYKNVDWSRVSKETVFKVMADVINENKNLAAEIRRLEREIEENAKTSSVSKDNSKSNLEDVAERISPTLIAEINNGKSFNVIEMKEYIINDVIADKKKKLAKINELLEQKKSYKELLDELQAQHYDLLEERNRLVSAVKNPERLEEVPKEDKQEFSEDAMEEIISQIPVENKREQKVILKAIPLDKARELMMQEDSRIICKILGEEGLSEFPQVQARAKSENISTNRFETVITNLEKEDIVRVEKIATFHRNSGLRLIELKDEVGTRLYREIFGKTPVKSEMQIIKEENDNYRHGYSIKDVVNTLKECYGFEDVSMSRDTNTIKVADRTEWVPDVIGINPLTKKKEYFEVEMGTHNQENFNYKLNKALLVTNEIKIVCQNKMDADKIMGKIKIWYNEKKSKPTLVVKVYTYPEFRNKIEGRFFPQEIEKADNLLTEQVKKDKKHIKVKEVKTQPNEDVEETV